MQHLLQLASKDEVLAVVPRGKQSSLASVPYNQRLFQHMEAQLQSGGTCSAEGIPGVAP